MLKMIRKLSYPTIWFLKKNKFSRYITIYFYLSLLLFFMLFIITGSSISKTSDEKIGDIKYEIIEDIDLPYDASLLFYEAMSENNRLTYSSNDTTYIMICYGIMPSSGYTINVDEFYETDSHLVLDTTLVGPKTREELSEENSYPALILKVSPRLEKSIIFK